MKNDRTKCSNCNQPITITVQKYCEKNLPFSLCYPCQQWLDENWDSTPETKILYLALKNRGLPVLLEKWDGHKTIDIAIPKFRINIEVDGSHHNTNPKQAFADLKRTYHSYLKNYHTFRIPNSLVREKPNETADYLSELIMENQKRLESERQREGQLVLSEINEKLLIEFVTSFYTVFVEDWGYSKTALEDIKNSHNILDKAIDNMNWNNRDQMVRKFREVVAQLIDTKTYNRILKDQHSMEFEQFSWLINYTEKQNQKEN